MERVHEDKLSHSSEVNIITSFISRSSGRSAAFNSGVVDLATLKYIRLHGFKSEMQPIFGLSDAIFILLSHKSYTNHCKMVKELLEYHHRHHVIIDNWNSVIDPINMTRGSVWKLWRVMRERKIERIHFET